MFDSSAEVSMANATSPVANCRYVENNPQYAESAVYLVKFRQLQVNGY
jgi:hypothetical protein